MSDPVVIDARGHRCPTPSLKLMKAMNGAVPGSRFVLLATDPMARIDVPFLMSQKNGRIIAVEETGGLLRLTVETGGSPDVPTD
ncbi:sulfurtransferase TusA family protein [Brevundimonas sp. G8]|uniref:sulfurtransferase TusA family protein n=1 Tax=Brevundimonas sp. G8 TaxID=1350776 RepID=UPI0012F056A2|nr:sulfurtransferase TusA family protein [Brevundimonas sp. G8]VXB60230.1 SirA family protein [Brevundimonas sp. G8]